MPGQLPTASCAKNWRSLTSRFAAFLALVLVLVLKCASYGSADLTRNGRSLTEYLPGLPAESRHGEDPLLVVTLLGGNVVAVRRDSGEVLWEYDTGTPLLRVSQGKAMPPGLHLLSGVDGGLYLYGSVLAAAAADGSAAPAGPTLERLPITLPELVDSSPSLTDDGSIITGERRTRVFALDRHTGALLHTFSEGTATAAAATAAAAGTPASGGLGDGDGGNVRGVGGSGGRANGSGPLAEAPDTHLRLNRGGRPSPSGPKPGAAFGMEDLPALHMLDLDRILLVGRQDFLVRSKQVLTDVEAWNATYSRIINILGPRGRHHRGAGGARVPPPAGGRASPGVAAGAGGGAAGSLPLFTVGADHSLQAYDPASGIRRWAVRFKTTPVGVFAAEYGDTNFLDPAAVHPLFPPAAPPPAQRRRQRGDGSPGPRLLSSLRLGEGGSAAEVGLGVEVGGDAGGRRNLVLVGELKGSLYAMPAQHIVLDERVEPQPWSLVALPGPASGPAPLPLPAAPSSGPSAAAAAGSTGKALVVRTAGGGGSSGSSSSGKDLVAYAMNVETGEGVVSGLACRPPGLQLLATVGETSSVRQPWLPDASKHAGGDGRLPLPGGAVVVDGGGAAAATGAMALAASAGGGIGGAIGAAVLVVLLVVLLVMAGVGAAAVLAVLRFRGGAAAAKNAVGEKPSASSAVALLAVAGVGAAAVLAVLRFRGDTAAAKDAGGEKPSASSAAGTAATDSSGNAASRADGAASATGATKSNGGRVSGSGQLRRKGRGGNGGGGGLRNGGGGPGSGGGGSARVLGAPSLPSIEEDRQLSPAEVAAPAAIVGSAPGEGPSSSRRDGDPPGSVPRGVPPPTGAATATDDGADGCSSAPHHASHLPSAEPRVQLREDGSLVIGRLVVGPVILGYGSAGTVVYEGVLDGRPVAVKRLLRQFTALARKEIEVLILSDEHPNVVRCFALEEDREFVYLALERCRSALSDALESEAGRAAFLDPASGQPTARCYSTLLDVCRGLAALHQRGIVHRDLKPHNVLLTESGQRAKLSDMGLSKQLVPEQSSFESHHGPGGSSGWQAPEQLIARGGGAARQTRSMDVFSLGCILHYCMTGGRHPFGDSHYERDSNILHGPPSLGPLAAAAGPEAAHLVATCLAKDPGRRPGVGAVLAHPLWWGDDRRLGFLVDISDRVENEDREPDTSLLDAMESYAGVALAGPGAAALDGPGGPFSAAASSSFTAAASPAFSTAAAPAAAGTGAGGGGGLAAALTAALAASPLLAANWGAALPAELVANLGRYRRYDFTSLRDLLRVMRNKRNHFREMPPGLQALLGPLPGGYLRFFSSRFPRLLLAVYVFALRHLPHEPSLQEYWGEGGAEAAEPFVQTFMAQYGNSLRPIRSSQQQQQQQQNGTGVLQALSEARVAGASNAGAGSGGGDGGEGSEEGAEVPSPPPGVATEEVQYGWVVVGYEPSGNDGELTVREFPRRPGRQQCEFFVKTGHCKFGESCVFDHPPEFAVRLTRLGLPLRPEEQLCSFYLKNNGCRFGPACKFHHPMLRPVYAGSAAAAAEVGVGIGGSGGGGG